MEKMNACFWSRTKLDVLQGTSSLNFIFETLYIKALCKNTSIYLYSVKIDNLRVYKLQGIKINWLTDKKPTQIYYPKQI